MGPSDAELGLDRDITRRDFLNGVAFAAGSMAVPGAAFAAGDPMAEEAYPPRRLGMRGSNDGSFEAAHDLRDGKIRDLGRALPAGETYDLVIVGGGLSGLAAAHYFQKLVGGGAKVLILDNHDDFGGHARRNEMSVQGRTVVINGGTLNIEAPERYNPWAKQLLVDIGVDLDRYVASNRSAAGIYAAHGLRSGYFFDREHFGRDRLVLSPEGAGRREGFSEDFVRGMPISAQAKLDLLRLVDPGQPDYLPGLTSAEKKARLARMSFASYLRDVAKVDEQAAWFFSGFGRGVFGVGSDATPALFAWQMGVPGFSGLGLEPSTDGLLANLPGVQHGRQKEGLDAIHFPDGNATIARLLVGRLVPGAVPASSQEGVGTARVDYAALDRAANDVRIRLNSTVLNVRHDGDVGTASEVVVTYRNGDALRSVRGRACIMACWNMVIPHLVPEMSAPQKEALAHNVKAPIVYTSVFLRNWRSFAKLGLHRASCPTMYHDVMELTEAVDLGELRHARGPDEPVAVHMTRMPGAPGLPRKEQHRLGRAELLATPFASFERSIRDQCARVLGPGGFDPARDIAGIAVNRWPHGYSYTYNSLYDPLEWVFSETDRRPCVIGRQPFGLISIANADAAASPHTDAAFGEAHRAVVEVLGRRAFPFVPRASTPGVA